MTIAVRAVRHRSGLSASRRRPASVGKTLRGARSETLLDLARRMAERRGSNEQTRRPCPKAEIVGDGNVRGCGQVEARLANMPPCLIGMEAYVGAHHLSRKLKGLGHDARLMPAKCVRPYSNF